MRKIFILLTVVVVSCVIVFSILVMSRNKLMRPTISLVEQGSTRIISFEDHINKGQSFKKDIGGGLSFKLTPTSSGWSMDVVSNNTGVDDYGFASIATPPFHGTGKNPLEINGEYYGPGDTTSGLLKQVSNFIFVLNKQDAEIVADTIDKYSSGKTLDFDPKISFFGKGVFRITNLKLEYASSSSDPFIKSMDFEVRLTFPLDIKTNNPL